MNEYACICYKILTLGNPHPQYLAEKAYICQESQKNAFATLDYRNMKRALDYCNTWNYPIPADWQSAYDEQITAAKEMGGLTDE